MKKPDPEKNWLVIYTRPRCEKKVADDLEKGGFTVYCPLIHTMRQWSDRKKKITLPMFPSYVFIHVAENQREKVLNYPQVLNFVFWLGKPALVRQREIDAIQEISHSGNEISVEQNDLSTGDYVEIKQGLFKGMTGLVNRKDKNQIVLYLKELNMKVSFEMKNTF